MPEYFEPDIDTFQILHYKSVNAIFQDLSKDSVITKFIESKEIFTMGGQF